MKVRRPDTCGECVYLEFDNRCHCTRGCAPLHDFRHDEEKACRDGKLNKKLWRLEVKKALAAKKALEPASHRSAPVELEPDGTEEEVAELRPCRPELGAVWPHLAVAALFGFAGYKVVVLLLNILLSLGGE